MVSKCTERRRRPKRHTSPVVMEPAEEVDQLILVLQQYIDNWLGLVWVGHKHLYKVVSWYWLLTVVWRWV